MANPHLSPSRRSETSYLALVIVPLIIVIGLLMFGLVQEWSARRYVNAELATLRAAGQPLDKAALIAELNGPPVQPSDATWEDLNDVIVFLEYKYREAFRLLNPSGELVPAGRDWPAEGLAEDYHREAAPLIERIRELLSSADMPPPPSGAYASRSLYGIPAWNGDDLLFREFAYAYHRGDSELAIELIELYVNFYRRIMGVEKMGPPQELIHRSLESDFWQADDLRRLRKLLNDRVDGEKSWHAVLDRELVELLEDVRMVNEGDEVGSDVLPFGVPSTRVASLLRSYADLEKLQGAGTRQHVQSVSAIDARNNRERGRAAVESLAAVPWSTFDFNTHFRRMEGNAASIATQLMSQRRLLVAIAIKQFQLQAGRWPTSLSELATVGLTSRDWEMVDGIDFGYRVDADGETARVWRFTQPYDGVSPDLFDKGFRFPPLPPSDMVLNKSAIQDAETEIR
ncbi:hypothetical protein [Allorhodopirellula heiligendammensis]|uniref:Uncharacterized protein n=1 Tax=Allorhodopirellula heiligendammensis TaxID=2714739 RepID=A0A5C6BC89_9BACT|nr:hypothetical protein [Allorhodopirellula heiligendammensis]TWU09865.1 hypothetical protein Poly21_54120 [Allorhodopirellula heiligendammensis]